MNLSFEISLISNPNKMLSIDVMCDFADTSLFFPLTDSDSHKQKLENFEEFKLEKMLSSVKVWMRQVQCRCVHTRPGRGPLFKLFFSRP